MRLARVTGENFRQFGRFTLEAAPRLNLIAGANAAGKTTLLEAIHCLGRGRSFRGADPKDLRGAATDFWRLVADTAQNPPDQIQLSWQDGGYRASTRAQPDAALLDLVRALPVQALEPGTHRLLEEGPGHRRRYLDWAVFHVEPRFLPTWRRYQRALAQRNRALKSAANDAEISSWDVELAANGEVLHQIREQTLPQLIAHLTPLIQRLLDTSDWTLDLQRGWSAELSLAAALKKLLGRDRRLSQTVEGPHRAELRVRLGGHGVRHRTSRGQQKLLAAALLLAQAALIREATGTAPVLLVDDFPSELGAEFQSRLWDALADCGSQVFVTALERRDWPLDPGQDGLFHVEQQQVRRLPLL